MKMYDIIMKKRNGEELSKEEIEEVIEKFVIGDIPDYQITTFLMAVYFQGMSEKETFNLTLALAKK